jgi:hypothetical protein
MKLDFKHEKGFLRLRVEGIRNPENVLTAAEQAVEKCIELGIPRVLVDVRSLHGGLTTFEGHYFSAHELPRLKRESGFERAAIIDLPENQVRFSFLEQVVQNRDLGMRFFCDEETALAWLLEDRAEP